MGYGTTLITLKSHWKQGRSAQTVRTVVGGGSIAETFIDMAKESYMLAQIVYSQLAETKCALNMAGYYLELSAEQALKHLYDDTEIPRSIQWLAIRIPADNSVAKTGILEMQDMINTWRDCTTSMRKEDIERGLNVLGKLLKEVEAYAGNSC